MSTDNMGWGVRMLIVLVRNDGVGAQNGDGEDVVLLPSGWVRLYGWCVRGAGNGGGTVKRPRVPRLVS